MNTFTDSVQFLLILRFVSLPEITLVTRCQLFLMIFVDIHRMMGSCVGQKVLLSPHLTFLLSGFLHDISGNYEAAFYLTGISIIISGVMILPIFVCKTKISHLGYRRSRCEEKLNNVSNSNLRNP